MKQLNNNLTNSEVINPYFVTGFADAESCFYIGIGENNRIKTN